MLLTADRIKELIKNEEGESLEFKAGLLGRDQIGEYAVAIGNEGGGTLVLGITNSKPRQIRGVPIQSADDLQQIRRSVLDKTGIRIELQMISVDGFTVLCIQIPSRLPGNVFHTKDGKYLMRSGEDLRGMSPVEIANILSEAGGSKPSGTTALSQMVKMAASNAAIVVTPVIPTRPEKFEFRVVAADARQIRLLRSASGQEVIIPATAVADVRLHAGSEPAELILFGRLQWLSLKEEWRYFDEMPSSSAERQFGFAKASAHQNPRVLEVCEKLRNRGFGLRWFNEYHLVNQMGRNWEIIYDDDGHYFKINDARMSQILAKTIVREDQLRPR
jgi:Putative DNA-binding domain